MKTGIFCYSLKGKETASKIAEIIKKEYDADIECFSPERMADGNFGPIPRPSGDFYGGHFRDKELFISVGSVGICVRHIAPYVKSKVTDPAVIVADATRTYPPFCSSPAARRCLLRSQPPSGCSFRP